MLIKVAHLKRSESLAMGDETVPGLSSTIHIFLKSKAIASKLHDVSFYPVMTSFSLDLVDVFIENVVFFSFNAKIIDHGKFTFSVHIIVS